MNDDDNTHITIYFFYKPIFYDHRRKEKCQIKKIVHASNKFIVIVKYIGCYFNFTFLSNVC